MILREPTLEELEKLEEEKLISRIENLNKSFKSKNKKDFLSAVTELYTSTSGLNLSQTEGTGNYLRSMKSKRSHSFDNIEGIQFDFNYDKNNNVNANSNINNYNNFNHNFSNNNFNTRDQKTNQNTNQSYNENTNLFNNSYNNKYNTSTHNDMPNPSKKRAVDPASMYDDKLINNNSITSSNSTNYTLNSVASGNYKVENIENIILQNLNISDETIKLIVIGDKAVGKTFFIDQLCANKSQSEETIPLPMNNEYKPTQSLEIKRFIFKTLNKIIKIELWDTNTSILNSPVIKTYFKLCHGFILTCDITNLESIKFLEKQIENIINYSTFNNDNISLYANIKENVNTEEHYHNLNYLNNLAEKYNVTPRTNFINFVNFVNFREFNVKKDFKFQKFVNSCLIKKVGKGRSSRINTGSNKKLPFSNEIGVANGTNNGINNSGIINIINNQDNNLGNNTNNAGSTDFKFKKESDLRDKSASPRTKKEKCIVF